MVNPAHRDAFLADVARAIEFAKKLEAPQIILMSGDETAGVSREDQWASLVEGARRAGDLAAKGGVTAIVEPLNAKVNHQGFFLTTCAEGLRLIKEAGHPHVRLLFDLYHEQVQAGDVTRTAVEAAPHVAVYHVADNPGRGDPGTGEMNYSSIYKAIAAAGYSGYITMEYLPRGEQVASLKKAVDGLRAALI
jgi:hydroxypyruvate isomerase